MSKMMDRRNFTKQFSFLTVGVLLPISQLQAKTFLSIEQAKEILWGQAGMSEIPLELSKEQMEAIRSASKIKVRNPSPKVWRTETGGWFIVDQVIGKHENIDMAFALEVDGKVRGLEILTYRETYGDEVMLPLWREQFHGKDHSERLRLNKQIQNISGATLSCRHVTEGINRLTQTWDIVLRHL